MPSFAAYATIVTRLECPHHFFHQRASTVAHIEDSRTSLGISITHPPKLGMQFNYKRRCGRSRSRAMQSHEEISDSEGVGNSEEGFVQIHQDVRRAQFSLAGRLRTFQCKPLALRSGAEIHSRPRRASQKRNVSGRISAHSEKIPSAVR